LGDSTEPRQDALGIVWRTEAARQSDHLIKCDIAPARAGRRPPIGSQIFRVPEADVRWVGDPRKRRNRRRPARRQRPFGRKCNLRSRWQDQ
jgi:hypothetical protein